MATSKRDDLVERLVNMLPVHDRQRLDTYYAAFVTVDDRYIHWWKQIGLGVVLVVLSGLGIVKDDQDIGGIALLADYLAPLALGYLTLCHGVLTLVDRRRRFYMAFFKRLWTDLAVQDRMDALFRYPRAATPFEYDAITILNDPRLVDRWEMVRRMLLVALIGLASIVAITLWAMLLYWMAIVDADRPALWVMRLMTILHGLSLMILIPLAAGKQ